MSNEFDRQKNAGGKGPPLPICRHQAVEGFATLFSRKPKMQFSDFDGTGVAEAGAEPIWSTKAYTVFNDRNIGCPASMHRYGLNHETWRLEDDEWRLARAKLHPSDLKIHRKEQTS
jgi:hypothetical protein